MYNAYKINKSHHNQTQRKTTFIGKIEAKILEYCITNNIYNVTPSELSTKLGIKNKYIWQALNYLIKRGIVTKVARGLYQVDRDKASVLLYAYHRTHKTLKDSDTCCVGRCTSLLNGMINTIGSGNNVVRVHVMAKASWSWSELFRIMLYIKNVIDYAVEVLRAFLYRLGFSRSAIRRITRDVVRDVSRFLQHARVVQGVHGFRVGGKYIRADGNDITMYLSAKEIGIDFISNIASVPKFHVKIYSTTKRGVASRPLLVWARS